jgi:hypothetical protein
VIRAALPALVLLAGCSSGKSLPAGAYRNDAFTFALVPPPGWTAVTPAEAGPFLEKHGERMLETARQGLLNPVSGRTTFVVAFVKTSATGPLLPMLGVTHNAEGLPRVGDFEKEKSRAAMKAKVQASGYVESAEEGAELVTVDGLPSVRLAWRGTVRSKQFRTPSVVQQLKIRFVDTMVACKSATHFLSLTASPEDWAESLAAYDQVLASFRSLGAR